MNIGIDSSAFNFALSGHSASANTSIAREIVVADGVAEFRRALRAPTLDVAGLTDAGRDLFACRCEMSYVQGRASIVVCDVAQSWPLFSARQHDLVRS